MGITFKENCPDLRNTKIIDIVSELKDYNINVDIYDPWVSEKDVMNEYCLGLTNSPDQEKYDAVIVAVAHNEFIEMGSDGIRSYLTEDGLLYDIKSLFAKKASDIRL